MLTLTQTARDVVKALTDQTPGAEQGGLRIASSENSDSDFSVEVAQAPEAADHVVDEGDAKVFLEQGVSEVLSDKVLDASVDESGAVNFAIGNAPEAPND